MVCEVLPVFGRLLHATCYIHCAHTYICTCTLLAAPPTSGSWYPLHLCASPASVLRKQQWRWQQWMSSESGHRVIITATSPSSSLSPSSQYHCNLLQQGLLPLWTPHSCSPEWSTSRPIWLGSLSWQPKTRCGFKWGDSCKARPYLKEPWSEEEGRARGEKVAAPLGDRKAEAYSQVGIGILHPDYGPGPPHRLSRGLIGQWSSLTLSFEDPTFWRRLASWFIYVWPSLPRTINKMTWCQWSNGGLPHPKVKVALVPCPFFA